MPQKIKTIKSGGVNCYLVRTETGFILIDTGLPARAERLERGDESKLKLSLLS